MHFRRFSLLLACMCLVACRSKADVDLLMLPNYSPFEHNISWAVVRVPYLRLQPSIEAKNQVSAILREGEVVKILQVRSIFEAQLGVWRDYYEVESVNQELAVRGWVTSDLVEVFQYEEAARRNSTVF